MKIHVNIILLYLVLCLISCKKEASYVREANHIINKYNNESNDLEKTLEFFKNNEPEKLKAAYILISNLEKSISISENPSIQKSIDLISPILKEKGKTSETFDIFNEYLNRIGNNGKLDYKRDADLVNSNMLIENIELAYQAVESLPVDLRPNDTFFYDFVLPYKSGMEPLEPGLRKNLLKEYGWVHSVIKKNNSIESGVCSLLDTLNLKLSPNTIFSGIPKVSQINEIKFGPCSYLVNLVVQILRSLGIPATSDFTEHWGNHYALGHEWLVFFSNETEYAIDVYDYRQLNNIYEFASLPKVYRKNLNADFSFNGITCEDVTKKYKKGKASDIFLEEVERAENVRIGVFNMGGDWKMLNAPKEKIEKGFLFKDVGNDIIYMAESIGSDDLKSKTPFFLNNKNKVEYLRPDYEKKIKAIITRKYPPSNVRDNGWKESWIESLAACKIMGGNKKDLSDAVELYNLKGFKTNNPINLNINNNESYKYYFLKGLEGNRTHIAEFYPITADGSPMDIETCETASDINYDEFNTDYILDDKSLTYLDANSLKILYTFKKPTNVTNFRIQARNDDNNVKPNNDYELFYWDKSSWRSLGRKVANDTLLVFDKVPSNSVYWLKNYTEGKEEHVFLLDSLGRQYWPGVTSLSKRLKNYWFCSQ